MMRNKFRAGMVLFALYGAVCGRAAPAPVVKELKLPNGMTVLALEDHAFPSVAIHTVFRVGSRNEHTGLTGLSHLFEHMMFNGSAHYPGQTFDREIEKSGGSSNAWTTPDTTEYFEEFSSTALENVLLMEADRMSALNINHANLEQERGIVKEERRMSYDNSVEGGMAELLWNGAYVAHPYHWLPIGFMKDIDAITLTDAQAYFREHYSPNNAVMAVVGDFKTEELFGMIRRLYSPIPRRPTIRTVVRDEPLQRGERRLTFQRAAELPALMIGYHIGPLTDKDDPALDLLSAILSRGESSRLSHAMVYQQQIATGLNASNESRMDPGLFTFYAQVQQGHTTEECLKSLDIIPDDIQQKGVTERELQKAKNALRVDYINSWNTNAGRAEQISEYHVFRGSWKEMLNYVPEHDRVTIADIQRAAKKYLISTNRTLVILAPEGTK